MLTTRFAGGLRARPLDGRPDRTIGAIFFVTDVRGLKDDEIAAAPDVCFTVVDPTTRPFCRSRVALKSCMTKRDP